MKMKMMMMMMMMATVEWCGRKVGGDGAEEEQRQGRSGGKGRGMDES